MPNNARTILVIGVAVAIIISATVLTIQRSIMQTNDTSPPALPVETARLQVGSHTITAVIARSLEEQKQGLSGQPHMAADVGMLFVYDTPRVQNFWMVDMRFPLDIIWINQGKIIGVAEQVPPPQENEPIARVSSGQPADMVLEVNGGFFAAHQLQIGDAVTILTD